MSEPLKITATAEHMAAVEVLKILFWVGCAGIFYDRAKKVTKALVEFLNHTNVKFAVLGIEESCTGDPKRAGNEFLFQMQAMNNITVLNCCNVKRVVTACSHRFNTLKNEYPSLGGNYEAICHTQLLQDLLDNVGIKIRGGSFEGEKITFHDPCYLVRGKDL